MTVTDWIYQVCEAGDTGAPADRAAVLCATEFLPPKIAIRCLEGCDHVGTQWPPSHQFVAHVKTWRHSPKQLEEVPYVR